MLRPSSDTVHADPLQSATNRWSFAAGVSNSWPLCRLLGVFCVHYVGCRLLYILYAHHQRAGDGCLAAAHFWAHMSCASLVIHGVCKWKHAALYCVNCNQ